MSNISKINKIKRAKEAVKFGHSITSTAESSSRVEERAVGPYTTFMDILKHKNYSDDISEHKRIIKNLCDNPLETYFNMRERLQKYGATASFPEFKPTVSSLIQKIFQDEDTITYIESNPSLKITLDQLCGELLAIQLEGRYMYPYKATILVIEGMLKLLDTVIRLKSNMTIPYYHHFRYRMYFTWLLDDALPNVIIFPCISYMGATLLIQTRCVPIALLGVIKDTALADRYPNTPLDFFMHDVQHWRRMVQEDQRYFDIITKHKYYYTQRSPMNMLKIDDLYEEMYNLSIKLLNLYKIVSGDSDQVKNYKKLKKLIIFEVCHEKGWPLTKFSLCRNIPLGYDVYPIEIMTLNQDTNNMTVYHKKITDPTTLSNLYHKLRHGFYDNPADPMNEIVSPKYRNARDIATAAHELIIELECNKSYELNELIGLTQDKTGAEEFLEVPQIEEPNKITNVNYIAKEMPYWQIEEEAPIYKLEGGNSKKSKPKPKKSKK
jgi:hypothetical protein